MIDDGHRGPGFPAFEFESEVVSEGYAYWISKNDSGRLPRRSDIRPAEIPRLLPDVMLLDVRREPDWNFRYRLIGTRVVEYCHDDYTGMWLSEIAHQRPPGELWNNFRQAAEQAMPLFPRSPYEGPRTDFRRAEDIILPLAEDGVRVDTLLIFVAFLPRA